MTAPDADLTADPTAGLAANHIAGRADLDLNAAASRTRLWPSLSFRDVDAMLGWLETVGFVRHEVHRDEHDPAVVVHAQLLWPPGGGIMCGSLRPDGLLQNAGSSAVYLVTPDPDAAFSAAVAAGGTVVRAMVDQDYGGRGGSVLDPEGNHWSFGDYQPG